ncbi:hypothetical protein [Giesbergeria giesbergeri]|uniref:Uncharacterized protein n=2 Tax=Giesbergeria sinuosa TaxID=80883 RepID=A0ABV9QA02_9BURK
MGIGFADAAPEVFADRYGRNMAGMASQGAEAANGLGMQLGQSYAADYQPYDKKFMQHVDMLGSDAYKAQQRGRAVAGVQQASDQQLGQMERRMASMGMANPSLMAKMQSQTAAQTALGKSAAAMDSDQKARGEWVQGIGAINTMGLKTGELGTKYLQMGSELGKVGLAGADMGAGAAARKMQADASMASAAAAGSNASASALNAQTNATKTANDYQLGLGSLATRMHEINTGNAFKQSQLDVLKGQSSLPSQVVSTGLGILGSAATSYFAKNGWNGVSNLLGLGGDFGDFLSSNAGLDLTSSDLLSAF